MDIYTNAYSWAGQHMFEFPCILNLLLSYPAEAPRLGSSGRIALCYIRLNNRFLRVANEAEVVAKSEVQGCYCEVVGDCEKSGN